MTLIERLEMASEGSRELDALVWVHLPEQDGHAWKHDGNKAKHAAQIAGCGFIPVYTTSLDAAMTLLPENWCIALLEWWPMTSIKAGITLREVKTFDGDFASTGYDEACGAARARAETPALAICIAALKALRAQAGEKS